MIVLNVANSHGMPWKVLSRNERCTEHAGRFFYAMRCSRTSAVGYMITEHDCDITLTGSAKPLRVWTQRYSSRLLGPVVREICGDVSQAEPSPCLGCCTVLRPSLDDCPVCNMVQDRHPSQDFEMHRAAMMARHAA